MKRWKRRDASRGADACRVIIHFILLRFLREVRKVACFFSKDLEVPLAFDRSSTSADDFRAKYGFERPGEDVGTKMLLLCRWGKLRGKKRVGKIVCRWVFNLIRLTRFDLPLKLTMHIFTPFFALFYLRGGRGGWIWSVTRKHIPKKSALPFPTNYLLGSRDTALVCWMECWTV